MDPIAGLIFAGSIWAFGLFVGIAWIMYMIYKLEEEILKQKE